MKRAINNNPLFKAAEAGAANKSTALTEGAHAEREGTGSQSKMVLSRQYIPVYRVELVRERAITIEPRRAIHNSDDVVAILKDELLKSDREKLISLMLNAKNVVIGIEVISIGTLTASLVSNRLCAAEHNLCWTKPLRGRDFSRGSVRIPPLHPIRRN
jgi:hypothetical protein